MKEKIEKEMAKLKLDPKYDGYELVLKGVVYACEYGKTKGFRGKIEHQYYEPVGFHESVNRCIRSALTKNLGLWYAYFGDMRITFNNVVNRIADNVRAEL